MCFDNETTYAYEDEEEVRAAFWRDYEGLFTEVPGQRQNKYNATIRSAFCMWLDDMVRSGAVSPELGNECTL